MAGQDRQETDNLTELFDRLAERPYDFGFFQALRRIECLTPDAPRLGASHLPADDPIRLAQEPSMTFESASLVGFEAEASGGPPKLTVRLLGLLGPNGPLPLHLTEYAQKRLHRHRDAAFSRFLDVFHHRMLTLFYRAWAVNEPTVSYDRPATDPFTGYVGSLEGLGMSGCWDRDELSDRTKRYYCGHLSRQVKCPEGLQAMVREYFDLPARVEEFVGEWVPLSGGDVFRLGESPASGTLGVSTVLGSEVWSCQHKFRILMGPLGYEDYQSFLPGGSRLRHLVALVRNYIGDESAWDLRLILKKNEVPLLALDGQYRMGWTAWLGERLVEEDADDLVLNVFAFINPQAQKETGSE